MQEFPLKKTFVFLCLIVFIFSLSGCGKLRSRFGKTKLYEIKLNNITAKEWYSHILVRAKKWEKDAVFYGIPETRVNLQGEGQNWSYLYSSKESPKQGLVSVRSGYISFKEIRQNVLPPVYRWNIDSIIAANVAAKLGGKEFIEQNPQAYLVMALYGIIPGSRTKRAIWVLKYYGETSILAIGIDANTKKRISLPKSF